MSHYHLALSFIRSAWKFPLILCETVAWFVSSDVRLGTETWFEGRELCIGSVSFISLRNLKSDFYNFFIWIRILSQRWLSNSVSSWWWGTNWPSHFWNSKWTSLIEFMSHYHLALSFIRSAWKFPLILCETVAWLSPHMYVSVPRHGLMRISYVWIVKKSCLGSQDPATYQIYLLLCQVGNSVMRQSA